MIIKMSVFKKQQINKNQINSLFLRNNKINYNSVINVSIH